MNPTRKKNIAAIDIGTNSFHLVVVEADTRTGRFRILDREKEIVRLGSGSTDMKYLSEASISRGILALQRFGSIAAAQMAPVRAIATSAVREANNRSEFIARARAEAGIKVEIASGAEEARLIYLGVLQALPIFTKRSFVVDIGGGSTEFVVGRGRTIRYANSLKLGAVRLTQRFFKGGRTDADSIKECRRYVRGMLAPITRDIERYTVDVSVGTSGTILNLASIVRLRSAGTAASTINGFTFQRGALTPVLKDILGRHDPSDRAAVAGMDQARVDIISAGCIILDEILRAFSVQRLTVSDYALREGIVLDTVEKKFAGGRVHHLADIQKTSVRHLADQFEPDVSHSRHVARLALEIFDKTQPLHGLSRLDRNYLETAALLHEIGLSISHSQHHKHSYYLIRNSDIAGYTELEKEIIANVARYHRKSHPKEKHEGFRGLGEEERSVVRRLSAILRIADGLDRTHRSVVRSVDIYRRGKGVHLRLRATRRPNLDMEIWGAERKKQLFEEVFGVSVKLVAA